MYLKLYFDFFEEKKDDFELLEAYEILHNCFENLTKKTSIESDFLSGEKYIQQREAIHKSITKNVSFI